MMRDDHCDVLPVLDVDGRMVGLITDRDICLAIAVDNRSPRAISVREVMSRDVVTVRESDHVYQALRAMKDARAWSLPVLDDSARVTGLLRLGDIVIRARDAGAVLAEEIVGAQRMFYERHPGVHASPRAA